MSRVPPYTTPRRPRSPPNTNGHDAQTSRIPSSTRPLQINRPPSRPETPNSQPSKSGVGSPSRPQRSELRSRNVSEYSDHASNSSFHMPSEYRDRRDNSQTSPSTPALSKVMSAFQGAGARRRAMTNDSADAEWEREREKERAREAELARATQQRIKAKVPGRRVNGKAKAGDIDAVLDQIKDEWEFVIDADFNPVDLALQLLDDSSLGKDMNSFMRTKNMLSKALKGSVDKHYQAFAAALPQHASLISHLGDVQGQIGESRTSLQEAKDALGTKRGDLVQLWSRGHTVEEMLKILDHIDHLKSVPEVLETLMSEKRLLQASVLLVRSLKMINSPDMLEVGAVSDLRSYLVSQETALREILVDELHSHLYLKSFWCEPRWAIYSPGQYNFSKVDFEEEPLSQPTPGPSQPGSPTSPTPSRSTRLSRFLHDLALRPNDSPFDMSESNNSSTHGQGTITSIPSTASLNTISNLITSYNPLLSLHASQTNPESDSFAYIETLLESLAVLGKLGNALDTIAQRLPGEIHSLVDSTIEEVSERAEYGRRTSMLSIVTGNGNQSDGIYVSVTGFPNIPLGAATTTVKASALRLATLESGAKPTDHETLKDLFWTLYSKFDAVTQGLRVIYEVSNRIGSRRDFKDSSGTKPGSLFPLAEIWMPLQTEVRTLLNDYLNDEEAGAVSGRNPISSINEALREGRFTRDKARPVFRFADTDMKLATKTLKQHEDELTRILRDTVPGLVHGSGETTLQSTLSSVGTAEDRLLGTGQHHRLLLKPDAFHVSLLFQPTLAFLARVADILPSGVETARASSTVLEEFVLRVYLPQLEEKVSLLFHQSITGPDAFQPDSSSTKLSPVPLIKASTQLMALVNSLCAMLRTTPFHQENYSRLILTVIIQFYQRCSDRFQDLVSLPQRSPDVLPRIAVAARWAQMVQLNPCLSELLNTPDHDLAKKNQLCRQETHLELFELLGDRTVKREDIITSTRNLSALCSLYHSVSWLATELNSLKTVPEDSMSPTSPIRLEPLTANTPHTPFPPVIPPVHGEESLSLPLSKEMALRFHALLKTYEQLAELILYTIRIDIRCRVIHYLDLSMRQGSYRLDREATEPDPYVIDLNNELVECDDAVSSALPQRQQRFVFEGLGYLIEHVLISDARHIHLANDAGVKKVIRNMVAVQQNLRTITTEDIEFERAKKYYNLFFTSPSGLLESIRQKQTFTFDEYKTMLGLQCGVDPSLGDAGISQATDRNYSMYVIDLHGLELENFADGS
ncbi:hypothetical protein JAAARDRAFT_169127 [Jaapia argillacea MUCL 33604]|uniref:Exocyst complex component Sec8 n=1 Tax=Jaapia argillacea MUCL 33604 TaxID=933084 RepID=A0A067Q8J5_9AGAM|nr:hypothetical protein JAAARDRAFT_169127 [Jaapia argillacea MUCL 33604]